MFGSIPEIHEWNSKTVCLIFPGGQDGCHISFVVMCYVYRMSTALFKVTSSYFSYKTLYLSFSFFGALILPHNFLLLSYLCNVVNPWLILSFKYCGKLIEFPFQLRSCRWFCEHFFSKPYNILTPCNSYWGGGGEIERERERIHFLMYLQIAFLFLAMTAYILGHFILIKFK